jgi:hypothetical protein
MKTTTVAFAISLCIVVAIVAWTFGVASADSVKDSEIAYAFVQTRVCAQNTEGFTPGLVLLGPATTRTSALRGSFTLDGNGGGSYNVDELQLNHNVTTTGSRQTGRTTSTCNVSYTVDSDGTIRLLLTDCIGTGLVGAVDGLTFTSTPQELLAQPSADGKTLLLSDVEPNVDDAVTTVESGAVAKRICSRTGTAVRLR